MTTAQKMQDAVKIIKDAADLLESHGEDASSLRDMLDANSKAVFATAGVLAQLDEVLVGQLLHLDSRMRECPLDEEFFCTNITIILGLIVTGVASLSNPEWGDEVVREKVEKTKTMVVMPRTKLYEKVTKPAMDYSMMTSPTEAYAEAIANTLNEMSDKTNDPSFGEVGKKIKKISARIIDGSLAPEEGMKEISSLIDNSPLKEKFKSFMEDKRNNPGQ